MLLINSLKKNKQLQELSTRETLIELNEEDVVLTEDIVQSKRVSKKGL